jgi:hypothetical protein
VAVVVTGDLQRDAARCVVVAEGLGIVGAGGDGVFRGDGGADGPEIDWVFTVVCDDGVANGIIDGFAGGGSDGD